MSELPSGWVETSLGAVIELKYGKSLPKGNRTAGAFNVYGSNGIVGTNQSSITSAPAIIVGRKGSFGEVNYSQEECFPIDTTYYVDSFESVDPVFCYALLRHLPLKTLNRATAIPGLNREDAYNLTFALPPLAEQKRIVAKLDTLNAKSARARTELVRIETLVSRYKQAVLSKAFSGELTREWRARVKAIEPRIGTLEELLSVPVRNGLSVKGSDTPPGFPALRLSALREREVRLNDVRYIPVDDDKARRFLLETGDILVSRGNGTRSLVGIASLVPTVVRATIFPDTAFRIRVDGAKALPLWLTSLWNAPQVRSQIELVAKTTAGIWKISQKDLATIQLSIPSTLEEQHEIVRRIEAAFARIYRLVGEAKRALELVGRLDEAILAKAFRGELVSQDDNDEPAEKLLERIRSQRQATRGPGAGGAKSRRLSGELFKRRAGQSSRKVGSVRSSDQRTVGFAGSQSHFFRVRHDRRKNDGRRGARHHSR